MKEGTMTAKHLTPETRAIIDKMLAEGKKIKDIVDAVKTAHTESTIKYDNVYNYRKRCNVKAQKQTTTTEDQNTTQE